MESAEPRKTTLPGGEAHGVMLCHRCGWPFPNAHPSSRHRRAHKRMCGTIEGYTVALDSAIALSHSHSQHSAVSSISDDERGSDGDSKASSVKGLVSRSVSVGSSGRVLERMNSSADDVFSDAVSEFSVANPSLAGDEGITTEIMSQNTLGVDGAVTGNIQASVNHESIATSPNLENVMSFSEIPAKFETMTNVGEENERANAYEDPTVMETCSVKIDDASVVSAAPSVAICKNASKTGTVTERRATIDLSMVKSETCQDEEKHDVKSGFEISGVDRSREGETLIQRSSDVIPEVKIEEIPQTKLYDLDTEMAMAGSEIPYPKVGESSKVVGVPSVPSNDNAVIVTNDVLDSGCENETEVRSGQSVVGIGAHPTNAEIETVETSSGHAVSGHVLEESSKKYRDSLARDLANGDNAAISAMDKSGQVASNYMIHTEYGFENRGIIADECFAGKEVQESDMNVDNLCLNIGSEQASSLPVVSVADTHRTTETEVCGDIGSGNTVQFSSDGNILIGDGSVRNNIVISKEVKLDCAEAADHVVDPKPVNHDVLLQKLEEDLSDDEPVETSLSTSHSLVNNKVEDVGVLCKDASSKDFGYPKERGLEHEKGTNISTSDPYEISSPNGSSSLDGNWGSVSVLSSMSDATADVKKVKTAQEGQSHAKSDIFDPPSFLTLIESEAQKAAAAAGSKTTEVQNPQQHGAEKAAWFPSINSVANDSHGRKKNEEIITKVTNWSAGKQHPPLKMLLSEAKSPETSKDNDNSSAKSSAPVTTLNSSMGSQEPELPKDSLEPSVKECPDEIKGEKRKAKRKPYWVPFVCCSSSVK